VHATWHRNPARTLSHPSHWSHASHGRHARAYSAAGPRASPEPLQSHQVRSMWHTRPRLCHTERLFAIHCRRTSSSRHPCFLVVSASEVHVPDFPHDRAATPGVGRRTAADDAEGSFIDRETVPGPPFIP